MEVWVHRCGYNPPHENMATHCRRRYRLVPPKTQNPNLHPVDPSLWIVHYAKAPSIDQVPVGHIRISPQTQHVLSARRFLQSQGQLARKDFMLHDRNNWPTINLPPHVGHPTYPPGHPYAGQLVSRQQPGAFYPPQQGAPAPMAATPSKPTRGHRPTLSAGGSGVGAEFALEEEDTATGDLLDNVTPRDISRMRYRNHHEWMEEVFTSPYPISQIAPVDLGLGRKGELESVTSGFFYAPSGPSNSVLESNVPAATGNMEPEKAEGFADAVSRKIAAMTAEMEAMKRKHERRMNKIRKISVLSEGESRLREAVVDPSNVGPEFWRIEDRLQLKEEEVPEIQFEDQTPKEKVDDIAREVLDSSGKSISPITNVVCVDKGGRQEHIQPVQPPASTADVNTGNSGPTPQQQTAAPQGQPSTSGIAPASISDAGESGFNQAPPPTASGVDASGINAPQSNHEATADTSQDVEMGGMQVESAGRAGDQVGGDWVMVDKTDNAPDTSKPGDSHVQAGDADAAAADAAGNRDLGDTGMLSTENFDDVGFNSAGEALAAYGEQNDGLDLGGMDNSAFGDAFHIPEAGEHVHHDQEDLP